MRQRPPVLSFHRQAEGGQTRKVAETASEGDNDGAGEAQRLVWAILAWAGQPYAGTDWTGRESGDGTQVLAWNWAAGPGALAGAATRAAPAAWRGAYWYTYWIVSGLSDLIDFFGVR